MAKDLTFEAKDFKMCSRGLHLCSELVRFLPKFGEDQKKALHPGAVRFSAKIFCPNSKGGHDSILRKILTYLCITGTPKGAMTPCPP